VASVTWRTDAEYPRRQTISFVAFGKTVPGVQARSGNDPRAWHSDGVGAVVVVLLVLVVIVVVVDVGAVVVGAVVVVVVVTGGPPAARQR